VLRTRDHIVRSNTECIHSPPSDPPTIHASHEHS